VTLGLSNDTECINCTANECVPRNDGNECDDNCIADDCICADGFCIPDEPVACVTDADCLAQVGLCGILAPLQICACVDLVCEPEDVQCIDDEDCVDVLIGAIVCTDVLGINPCSCAAGNVCVLGLGLQQVQTGESSRTATTECIPGTCESLGIGCGNGLDDGCGGILDCGECEEACVPLSCADLGIACGPATDNCGNAINCGECCVPTTCEQVGCGGYANDCVNGDVYCGDCCIPADQRERCVTDDQCCEGLCRDLACGTDRPTKICRTDCPA
jgi:hypothetical protein